MFDGVIFIFDFFEFLVEYCVGDDIIMVICFGIVNYSEKQYICIFVDYVQKNGYWCVVLNYLGVLFNIELILLCMFIYGCMWEFGVMVNYIKKIYFLIQLVVVGFSLGGNIVCKYLGEIQVN